MRHIFAETEFTLIVSKKAKIVFKKAKPEFTF